MKKVFLNCVLLLCALIVGSINVWADTYKKVTSAPTSWAGEYLIVYENSSTEGYVWTGVDAGSCYATATISNGAISKPSGAVSVTIASMTGGYSIKVNGGDNNGKYIQNNGSSNGIKFVDSGVATTFTYENSSTTITCGGKNFRYNSNSDQKRFRYFGSAQQVVQLYKLAYAVTYNANGGTGTITDANSPYYSGSTVTTKTNTFTRGGYEFTGWNTASDGSGTSYAEGATFTPNANTTLYAQWTVAGKVETPTFTVPAGTYNAVQSVGLECGTSSSTIYYTTDGTDPTTSSSVYSGAISVNVTTTIKAIAVADGLDDSNIASATYTLKCVTPTITIPDGAFVSSKVVTMASTTDGATIYYTTDGSTTPTSSSTAYDPSHKPSISATTTIKAISSKSGWSDSDVATETFTKETVLDGLSALVAKTNTSDQSYYVELSDAQVTYVSGKHGFMEDDDAGIYLYNISPTLNKVYNGIFRVTYQLYNSMPELKAIAVVEGEISDGSTKDPTEMTASALSAAFNANLGRKIQITGHTTTTTTVLVTGIDFYTTYYNPSFEKDHIYTIVGYPYNNNGTLQFRVISAVEKPDAPTISPDEGEFSIDFTLTLSAADGAVIRYTTDGSTPTASVGSVYDPKNKPTISAGADVTVKAVAVLAGMTSEVASATYTYSAISRPSFAPVDGTSVYYGETIELACDVDGSTIYYTTDGSTPTSSSSVYSSPIAIEANSVTIKAKANKDEDWSSEASATFTLKTPDKPTTSPAAGAVETGTSVMLNSRVGTTIYYTLDGSTPDNGSTPYSSAIMIDAAKTIKAIAYDGAGNSSSVLEAAYTILKVSTPSFGTAAGSFPISREVSINCETDGATIYYTTDGSDPTTSSSIFSAPFYVTETTTIKAFAVKANCTNSNISSVTYTKATIYTVAQVISGAATGSGIYVKGYIVGNYNSTSPVNPATTNTNFALADDVSEDSGSKTIPVELTSGSGFRTTWGPYSNNTIGYQVIIKGNKDTYFSVNGIKGTSEIIAISVPATVSAAGWATFNSDFALDLSSVDCAYAVTEVDGSVATAIKVQQKVAKNTPLLIKGAGTHYMPVIANNDAGIAEITGGNMLVAVTDAEGEDINSSAKYILTKQSGNVVFAATDLHQAHLNKGQAYLQYPAAAAPDGIRIVEEENNATNIETIESSNKAVKFIQNGQLYILRDGITYDAMGRVIR